ncbi:MAG: CDP-alcohol phosphatidyltransferase family protein [Candidatus Rokubacteria bacterium]|nr:CDP-alcohol phosphatidyltransferase family protein [Candidatus Rokubacteria bacterium]
MTADAVLYLASPDDLRAARLSLAGRPLAFRVVMAAVRAGARRVAVPAVLRDAALEAAIARTPSARRAVEWLAPDTTAPAAPIVLLPAGTLVTVATVSVLVMAPPAAIVAGAAHGAPVAAAAPATIAPLWRALSGGEPVGAEIARALAAARAIEIPAAGIVERVASADADDAAATVAETRLLGTLGSPIDTAFDRAFHRRLSAPVTRWAVERGVTANAITIASIVVGLFAAVAVAVDGLAGVVIGVGLYVAAVVLDHADGEVARVGFAESRLGEWLDIGGDTAVHTALVLAMGTAAHRASGAAGWLGAVAAIGVIGSAWVMKTSPPRADPVGRVFLALGNRDGFYAMLLAFLAALALLPAALPALMVLLAAGTHAYWLGSLFARLRRS